MRKMIVMSGLAALLLVPLAAAAGPAAKPTTTTGTTTTTTAASGIAGYEVVTSHVDIDPGGDVAPGTPGDRMAAVGALCPLGKRPLGGGGGSIGPHLYPGRNDVILQGSFPWSAGNQEGWKVATRRVGDDTTNGYTVDVWAICATAT